MRKHLFVCIMMALMLISGCATHKETVKNLNLSLVEVFARVRERHAFIKTLNGDGTITVEEPKTSNSGSFDVDLKKPDSVRVELHGPFGLHVGTLSLSRNRFIYYNKMNNSAAIGRPDGHTLQSLFHLKMEFDEILNVFTGEFPISVENDSLEQFFVENDQYVAVFNNKHERKEYRIDAGDFIINNYRVFDSESTIVMSASATRPTTIESIVMPTLLRIVFPKEHRSVTIAYDDIVLNESVECFFSLPENVERVNR